ncbi:MAG: peptidoglycan DD-metalloendopeptidase family protein [Defluviitaleaceae bacterium]|nr:peptidoglycan DD-metalloendopeptidase family protein [Defluviitaleaceae bacterium]
MFFKRSTQETHARPTVKKVSELINTKSHKQKKYVSLMLVPSYSTGKTRSLRVPRAALHGVIISILAISAVITGLHLRNLHFERMARNLSEYLGETQEAFYEFQQISEQMQSDLIDATAQMYEQFSEEQIRAQREMDRQARRHQYALEDIWDHIDELERQIRGLDDERQELMDNLGARSIIPPIAGLMRQLEASQRELRSLSDLDRQASPDVAPAIGLMGFGGVSSNVRLCEDELLDRLILLKDELNLQRKLLDDIENHRLLMEPYLSNYPTLWPIRGSISSGFGWRRNPMGGSGSEHHDGVDIPARTGTPIRAAGGGTVTFAGWRNGYGNTVIIDHGSGISTLYAHNTRNSVSVGQEVARGDIIAYVGSTGRSTGPHLHYEVHVNGVARNPVPFLLEHYSS